MNGRKAQSNRADTNTQESYLSTERIGKKIGTVLPEELTQIIKGLKEIIGG